MGTGYTRADTANNIADGNIINASDLDSEYDAIQSAFDASTGHTHDGTAGEGAPIETIGPTQDVVATASVLRPKTDNTVDLGTTTLEYKDLFLDGTAHIDTLDVDENASITGTLGVTGATTLSSTLGVTGATTLSSTLGVTGATTLSSTLGVTGAATLSSTLAVTGATGIDGDFDINTNKFTVASATGNTAVAGTLGVTGATTLSSTLGVTGTTTLGTANITTGTITTADINGGNIDGTIIGATTAAAITGTTITGTSFVTSGDMTFGDNDKAIFGAGSDLQIYHDGSNSYIVDAGTGDLYFRSASNLYIGNAAGTQSYITATDGGAVTLLYNAGVKLATTSTGVDISGTLTSDGLTVDGKVLINTPASAIAQEIRGRSSDDVGYLQFSNNAGTTSSYIGSNGSYLNFEVGSAERMRIDSSGNVMVGGTVAGNAGTISLSVGNVGSTNGGLQLWGTTTGTHYIQFGDESGTAANHYRGYMAYAHNGDSLFFGTASTEAMRIDSSGNVGIGTSSPVVASGTTSLTIYNATASALYLQNSTTGTASTDGSTIQVVGADLTITNRESGYVRFNTANTERMRIDSSGNLLVGTTSFTGTSGVSLSATGYVYASSTNDVAIYANRESTDGDIAVFRKDGATVGSIGTTGGYMYAGSGNTYLYYDDTNNIVRPSNSAGAARDNIVGLGNASNRFTNLYLSGGVYLGGTGSANKLDDYEEGTWTPTYTSSGTDPTFGPNLQDGLYTKIGRLVYASFRLRGAITGTKTGNLRISGLPFTSNSSNANGSGSIGLTENFGADNYPTNLRVNQSATYINLMVYDTADPRDGLFTNVTVASTGAGASDNYIIGHVVYQV